MLVEWLLFCSTVTHHVCNGAVSLLSHTWCPGLCGWASNIPTPPLVSYSALPLRREKMCWRPQQCTGCVWTYCDLMHQCWAHRRCTWVSALCSVGTATRFCNSNGMWEDPDLTQCETATFRDIRMTVWFSQVLICSPCSIAVCMWWAVPLVDTNTVVLLKGIFTAV